MHPASGRSEEEESTTFKSASAGPTGDTFPLQPPFLLCAKSSNLVRPQICYFNICLKSTDSVVLDFLNMYGDRLAVAKEADEEQEDGSRQA